MVQLSHLYMTTGRTIDLIIQTLVGKVMSLLFNMMARLVMGFLPRGNESETVIAMSDSLQPHILQQARLPCPSFSSRVCSNSCPLSQWFYLTNHLILCFPLLLLPSIFASIRVFCSESTFHIRWPKYWSFSVSPSNEYFGLISFRIYWFVLLAVQGTLISLLQHHSLKASIL